MFPIPAETGIGTLYAHGITYDYNEYGVTGVRRNGVLKYQWNYGDDGALFSHVDLENSRTTQSSSDSLGRTDRVVTYDHSQSQYNDRTLWATEYGYDANNNVSRVADTLNGQRYLRYYEYGADNLPTKYYMEDSLRTYTYTYDILNRPSGKTLSTTTPYETTYVYWQSDPRNEGTGDTKYKTTLLKHEIYGNTAWRYTYDAVGNIVKIEEGVRSGSTGGGYSLKITYEYDALNQLTRENNLYTNITVLYTYDNGGNILSKKEYAYTTAATPAGGYGNANWKDLLFDLFFNT